jgi:hypothetical protein
VRDEEQFHVLVVLNVGFVKAAAGRPEFASVRTVNRNYRNPYGQNNAGAATVTSMRSIS